MRNLKRMLCLALTVVMLVGMMVVGAGAAGINDFGDVAEIEHKDAVALLVELGVINGNNDGNFYPQGTLTREQMAKIAYLVMNVNQNYSMYEGTASALTDVAGRWSTGAIAWCNVNGIIAGGNDGTFSPEGTLTVAQTQTFLLRVLGYDNKLSGLTGTGWDINASILAQERGLMAGLDGLKSGDPITRDQACQMAFNALFITPVEVEKQFNFMTGEMVATGYKTEDGKYTGKTKAAAVFKLEEKTATIGKVGADGKAYDADNAEIEGLTATPDMVGATVTYYVRNDKVVSGATANGSKVIATIGAADWADSKKVGDKGEYIPADKVEKLDYFVNNDAGEFVAGSKNSIVAGSVIELVNTNDDAKFEVVRIINKKVATLGDDPVVSSDGKKVTVAGVVTDAKIETVKGYEDLKADDVVLYYAMTGVTYIEKANVTSGKVSSVTSGNVYSLGSDKLSPSGLNGADAEKPAGFDFDNEYDFYLDNYNNIVAVNKAGAAPTKPVVKYAVVLDFGYKGTVSGEIDAESKTTYQVKLLFPETNTQEIVTLNAIIKNAKATSDEDKYEALTTSLTFKSDYQHKLVSYTVADNEYTLTKLTDENNAEFAAIDGGKAVFAENFVANSKTIFLVGTGAKIESDAKNNDYSKVKFTTYTGYANAPTIGGDGDDAGELAVKGVVKSESGIATLVYVIADKLDGTTSDELNAYVLSKNYTETSKGYEYSAVVDGEVVTLIAETPCFVAEGFYAYTTNADGVIKDAPTAKGGILTGITAAGDGIIKVKGTNGEEVYAYDEATKIYSIKNGKAELIGVDKLGAGEKNMSRVIIVKVAGETELIDYMYVLPAAPVATNNNAAVAEIIGQEIPKTVHINEGATFKTEGDTITVTGTVAYSEGFEWFNTTNKNEQKGGFISLTLTAPNAGMTYTIVKGNNASTKTGDLDPDDTKLDLVLWVDGTTQTWTVEFSKDGEQTVTYTIDASKLTVAEPTPAEEG